MPEIRTEEEIREDLTRKLNALVDQARLVNVTSTFMRKVMEDVITDAINGIQDTDRLRYLAKDRESWRAIYDLAEANEGSMAEDDVATENLRGLIDSFAAMDAEAEG